MNIRYLITRWSRKRLNSERPETQEPDTESPEALKANTSCLRDQLAEQAIEIMNLEGTIYRIGVELQDTKRHLKAAETQLTYDASSSREKLDNTRRGIPTVP